MPSLIDIRRRIRSVKNTQQITKAMKMVSAAKLRRAQDRTIASRPYAAMLRKVLGNVAAAVASNDEAANNPLLARREENRILLVHPLWDLARPHISEWNAHVLSLPPVVPPGGMRIAVDTAHGARIGIDVMTITIQLSGAEKARSTSDVERHTHPITPLQVPHG